MVKAKCKIKVFHVKILLIKIHIFIKKLSVCFPSIPPTSDLSATLCPSAAWLTLSYSQLHERLPRRSEAALIWPEKKVWIKISQTLTGYIKQFNYFNLFHISWNYVRPFPVSVPITVECRCELLHQPVSRNESARKGPLQCVQVSTRMTPGGNFHHNPLIHSVISSLRIMLPDYNVLWLVSAQS